MFDFDTTTSHFPKFLSAQNYLAKTYQVGTRGGISLFSAKTLDDVYLISAALHKSMAGGHGLWLSPESPIRTAFFTSLAGIVIKWLNHQLPIDKVSLQPTKPELKQDTPRPVETKSPILFTGRPWAEDFGTSFQFLKFSCFQKVGGQPQPPKMDGLFHGKPN